MKKQRYSADDQPRCAFNFVLTMSTIWVTAFSWWDEQKKQKTACRDLDSHSCSYDVAARCCFFLSLTDVGGECAGVACVARGQPWHLNIPRRTVSLPAPSCIPSLGCASRRGVETRLFLGSAFLNHDWAPSHRCNKTRECHRCAQAQASNTWRAFSHSNVFTGVVFSAVLFDQKNRSPPCYIFSVYSSVGLGLRCLGCRDFSRCLAVQMRS